MFQAFLKFKRLKTTFLGFPGGSVVKKSALQCKGHQFDPWSRKIPHAEEQLSLCATTTKPMSCNYWSLHAATGAAPKWSEKPLHTQQRAAPLLCYWRKPAWSNEEPPQCPPKTNLILMLSPQACFIHAVFLGKWLSGIYPIFQTRNLGIAINSPPKVLTSNHQTGSNNYVLNLFSHYT